ncbi:unnamed protein product, partial [Discosporangium mesarthrocarpum]
SGGTTADGRNQGRNEGRKKAKMLKKRGGTIEVSDNFVRADMKSRGSSKFKRKNSLRSKARGGATLRGRRGGQTFPSYNNARTKSNLHSWVREDPITGEKQ